MINLLSTERKSEIRAARTNVILARYIGIIVIAISFIMVVLYVSYTVLEQTMESAESRISSSDTKAGVYSATKQQVDALSAKLNDTKLLLNQEISYARILTTLGQAMPAGTYLEALSIDSTTVSGGSPVELVARAKTDTDAAVIQQNFQGIPLFSQVSLVGTTSEPDNAEYPVKITLTVVFNGAGV